MPNLSEKNKLLVTLQEHEGLRARGYSFLLMNGVFVEREGHARGLWRCANGGFSWTPAGYNEPIHWVEDTKSAVNYILNLYQAP